VYKSGPGLTCSKRSFVRRLRKQVENEAADAAGRNLRPESHGAQIQNVIIIFTLKRFLRPLFFYRTKLNTFVVRRDQSGGPHVRSGGLQILTRLPAVSVALFLPHNPSPSLIICINLPPRLRLIARNCSCSSASRSWTALSWPTSITPKIAS